MLPKNIILYELATCAFMHIPNIDAIKSMETRAGRGAKRTGNQPKNQTEAQHTANKPKTFFFLKGGQKRNNIA